MLINVGGITIQTHWLVLSEFKNGVLTLRYTTNNDTGEITIKGKEAEGIHNLLIEEAGRDVANSKANFQQWQVKTREIIAAEERLDALSKSLKEKFPG